MLNAKSFLAVDFGAGSLKLAEFERNEAGGLRLKQYGIRPLGIEGAQEANREASILKGIQELLAEKAYTSRQINVCAPGFHVFSKFVKLPPVDTSKVTQIIQYEAQQNVPFPLEEVVWDYQILGTSPTGELEVLLVAIKSEIVEGLFRVADGAGMRLELVDVSPAALRHLFRDVDVDRIGAVPPLAEDRRAAIELPPARTLAAAEVPDLGTLRDTLAGETVDRQLATTLLELIARRVPQQAPEETTLWRLEDLYRGFLLAGAIAPAAGIVEALRESLQKMREAGGSEAELRRCVDRLANRETVAALLAALPQLSAEGARSARRLIDVLGPVAVRHLVAALPEETDRTRRHQLLDLLAAMGPAVVPPAALLLADPRWYVVRNMILLLRTVGDQTTLPQVRRCAEHADLRVRLEAIKSLFAADSQRSADLLAQAINDRDPKVAEAAIGLVASYNITQGVAPLAALLRRWDPLGLRRPVRLRALRTLGVLADPAALPQLEPFFSRRFHRYAREERLAAYATLGSYPEPARRDIVTRGLRSRDPEVRALCARAGSVETRPAAEEAP